MSRIRLAMIVAVCFIALSGCRTLDVKVDQIRSEEEVLFAGLAKTGIVSYSGDAIYWDESAAVPITATPMTLYVGLDSMAYTWIDSVEVGSFHSVKQLFVKEATYDDLIIITDKIRQKRVLMLLPEDGKIDNSLGGSDQRALADSLAGVIETQRAAVDSFGLLRSPQEVWIATNPGPVFELWWSEPRYFNDHFLDERRRIDLLFKSVRKEAAERFFSGIRPAVLQIQCGEGEYSFADVRELNMRSTPHHKIVGKLGLRDRNLSRLVLIESLRIFLEEKLDPQGNPSLRVRFSFPVRLYDLDNARLANSKEFDYTVSLPLREWLDGGRERILAELERAMIQGAEGVHHLIREK